MGGPGGGPSASGACPVVGEPGVGGAGEGTRCRGVPKGRRTGQLTTEQSGHVRHTRRAARPPDSLNHLPGMCVCWALISACRTVSSLILSQDRPGHT